MENEVRIKDIEELSRVRDAYGSESLFKLFVDRFNRLFNQGVKDVLLETRLLHIEIWREAKAVAKEIYSLRADPKQIDDFYKWRCRRYEGLFSSEEAQEKSGMLTFAVYHVAYLMMKYVLMKDKEYVELFKFEKEVNMEVQLTSVDEYTGDRETCVCSCKDLLTYIGVLLDPFSLYNYEST